MGPDSAPATAKTRTAAPRIQLRPNRIERDTRLPVQNACRVVTLSHQR